MDLKENAVEFVRKLFAEEYSGHDFYHTMRVYRLAERIAEKENADIEITSLAAILHDVDDRKLSPETCQNKDRARNFLSSHGADGLLIDRIADIIGEVSFEGSESRIPSTIEGKCVQDADRLDAIGAIGIARAFAYGGNHGRKIYDPDDSPKLNMTADEYHSHVSTSLNHFYEKLFLLKGMLNTGTAREIAEERDTYMHEFVGEFLDEWNGKK